MKNPGLAALAALNDPARIMDVAVAASDLMLRVAAINRLMKWGIYDDFFPGIYHDEREKRFRDAWFAARAAIPNLTNSTDRRVAEELRDLEQEARHVPPGGGRGPDIDDFMRYQSWLYGEKRFERALACVLHARMTFGDDEEVLWNRQGLCLSDLKRFREALDCYEHGLELNPNSQRLWCNKGRTLRAMGRHAEALVCYDKAIPINPREPTPWDCRGNCLLDLGLGFEESRRNVFRVCPPRRFAP